MLKAEFVVFSGSTAGLVMVTSGGCTGGANVNVLQSVPKGVVIQIVTVAGPVPTKNVAGDVQAVAGAPLTEQLNDTGPDEPETENVQLTKLPSRVQLAEKVGLPRITVVESVPVPVVFVHSTLIRFEPATSATGLVAVDADGLETPVAVLVTTQVVPAGIDDIPFTT